MVCVCVFVCLLCVGRRHLTVEFNREAVVMTGSFVVTSICMDLPPWRGGFTPAADCRMLLILYACGVFGMVNPNSTVFASLECTVQYVPYVCSLSGMPAIDASSVVALRGPIINQSNYILHVFRHSGMPK